jgi:hypothetical protein
MGSIAVERFLDAVQSAGFARTEAFAANAVSDSTVPNWRLQLHGGAEIRAKYSGWFDHPATLAEVRRTPLPDGELVEYTRSWTQSGVPHKGHHIHRFTILNDQIVEDAHWCGGRWNEGILKEIAAAGHRT